MVGKDCVAIASALRLGLQALTISNNFPKIFQYGDVFLGLTGLATDVSTVSDLFRYKVNMYRLREERNIAPTTFANLVSSSLYERRFGPYFVSPVVAGLEPKSGKPFICSFDSIGCIDFAKDFIVSGTATEQLFGMCESLWEPDLVRSTRPPILFSLSSSLRSGISCPDHPPGVSSGRSVARSLVHQSAHNMTQARSEAQMADCPYPHA